MSFLTRGYNLQHSYSKMHSNRVGLYLRKRSCNNTITKKKRKKEKKLLVSSNMMD